MPKSAGSFSGWLRRTRRTIHDGADADVPCGTCTACCRNAKMLVPLTRAEEEHYPEAILGDDGRRYIPRNPDGSCTKLVDGKCTIYARRPETCRSYDCRWLLAAGEAVVAADEPWLDIINLDQWSGFELRTVDDVDELAAFRLALAATPAGGDAMINALTNYGSQLTAAQAMRQRQPDQRVYAAQLQMSTTRAGFGLRVPGTVVASKR